MNTREEIAHFVATRIEIFDGMHRHYCEKADRCSAGSQGRSKAEALAEMSRAAVQDMEIIQKMLDTGS